MAENGPSEHRDDPQPEPGGAATAESRSWTAELSGPLPSWLTSMIVHMLVLILLALVTLPPAAREAIQGLVASTSDAAKELEELGPETLEQPGPNLTLEKAIVVSDTIDEKDTRVSPVEDVSAAAAAVELDDLGFEKVPRNDLLTTIGAYGGDALSGRGDQARKGLVAKRGGSEGSEQAVANALKWLAAHQMPDGGWSFAHQLSPHCEGQCRDPGMMKGARLAATGLALLPFLGAGKTQKQGEYQRTVQTGLYFLVNHQDPKTGSLYEPVGSMYSHGIASIALCEAYAMTQDRGLLDPAQKAIHFTCYAQDPVGGGWRYEPREPGDTSVLGWQIMALKSGHMAYLRVPPAVIKKAYTFLDSVQVESGAKYGYMTPGEGQATTAIGLLCRMYLGWKKNEPALERGVAWLGALGPADNLYYNYYATQVMLHWEGEPWKRWNSVMRDRLVESQSRAGHETGSWHMPGDPHARFGGRLYCTAMATMILEVYYRHMPIYAERSTEKDFPID